MWNYVELCGTCLHIVGQGFQMLSVSFRAELQSLRACGWVSWTVSPRRRLSTGDCHTRAGLNFRFDRLQTWLLLECNMTKSLKTLPSILINFVT